MLKGGFSLHILPVLDLFICFIIELHLLHVALKILHKHVSVLSTYGVRYRGSPEKSWLEVNRNLQASVCLQAVDGAVGVRQSGERPSDREADNTATGQSAQSQTGRRRRGSPEDINDPKTKKDPGVILYIHTLTLLHIGRLWRPRLIY